LTLISWSKQIIVSDIRLAAFLNSTSRYCH